MLQFTKKTALRAVLVGVMSLMGAAALAASAMTDTQVKQAIVKQSIASYSGNCPCPENRASNGSRCGKRSAYSRKGGEAPLCYVSDVTKAQVEAYRKANNIPKK